MDQYSLRDGADVDASNKLNEMPWANVTDYPTIRLWNPEGGSEHLSLVEIDQPLYFEFHCGCFSRPCMSMCIMTAPFAMSLPIRGRGAGTRWPACGPMERMCIALLERN